MLAIRSLLYNAVFFGGGFVFALLAMYGPAKELSTANSEFQESLPGAERVFQILDMRPEVKEGTQTLPAFRDALQVIDSGLQHFHLGIESLDLLAQQ